MTNPALHAEMRGPVSQTRGFSVATNDMILGSVDSHVIEPPTMFDARNPENYRDQAPSVRENGTQYGQLFLRAKETLSHACLRASNDWHTDERAGTYPERIIAMSIMPLWDPQLMPAEIRGTQPTVATP